MSDDDAKPGSETKGKIKEAVGNVTGDRHLEAVGRAEAETGAPPDGHEAEKVEEEVRRDHGDISQPPPR